LAQRRQEIGTVRTIITDELEHHRLELSAREVAPLVTALRSKGDELRRMELERYRARLERLDPATQELVDALTRGVVNKLLHDPTTKVKESAGTARGGIYADALGELFGLTEPAAGPDD